MLELWLSETHLTRKMYSSKVKFEYMKFCLHNNMYYEIEDMVCVCGGLACTALNNLQKNIHIWKQPIFVFLFNVC